MKRLIEHMIKKFTGKTVWVKSLFPLVYLYPDHTQRETYIIHIGR